MMEKQKVAIIGAGNVGSILAKAFYKQGYELTGIASKTITSAGQLARLFGVLATTEAAEITRTADLVVIATPDRYIMQVTAEIAQTGGFKPGQVVVHTSGTMSVASLNIASELGAFTGGIHPLQSFADRERDVILLRDIYFAVAGHKEAINMGRKIAQEFGGKSFILGDEQRALYHAGACIVSNYFVALFHWATQLYEGLGLTTEQAMAALMPLVQGTMKNVGQLGPTQALTGPVSRGDGDTIMTHLAALKNKQEQELYATLARYTLGIALEKGTLHEGQAMVLKDQIQEEMERIT